MIFWKGLAIVNLKKGMSVPTESCASETQVLSGLIIVRLTSTVLVPMIQMSLFVFLLIPFVRKVDLCYVSITVVQKRYIEPFQRAYFVILMKLIF